MIPHQQAPMPDVGVLVLEVKGGAVSLRDGRWFRSDRPMERSPRERGARLPQEVVAKLKERGIAEPPLISSDTLFNGHDHELESKNGACSTACK